MKKVIVLIGQTAVGKTKLSIDIAKRYNGEIINGDAMQVYKELNIISDKIKEDEKQGVIHHLLDIVSINENYDVEKYQKNIREVIDIISNNNHLPIIVGGTGLYIKAALYDYNFEKQDVSNEQFENKYKDYSNQELYDLLVKIDYEASLKIHPNNRRRVLRALSIYENTGKRKSDIINIQNHQPIYDVLFIGLENDKDLLNTKIDERIDKMFENGIVDEVKNNPTNTTASKAIGYQEITDYLNNKITLNEAKELMKIHTHQYAKRQRTFFKHQFDVNWIKNDNNALDNINILIDNWIKKEHE